MSEELRSLLDDLTRYLRQQQESGKAWYYDAGAPPPPAAATAKTQARAAAPPPKPAVAPPPPAATSAKAKPDVVRPVGASLSKQEREDAFLAECETFVNHTMDRIAARTADTGAGAEPDIFASAAASTEQPVDQAAALAEAAAEVAGCTACKLHGSRIQTVFGMGDPAADLVFIGEAPGRNEDEQGQPFVGRAGKLLTDILKAIGLERDDVYICNILKCRPPENRDPEPDEVRACEPFLKRQLAILEPKVICCLGRHAAMTLLQTRASLGSMRETVHFYEGIPVMATYHPAALLRNPHWKRDVWDDVRKLRALHAALAAGD